MRAVILGRGGLPLWEGEVLAAEDGRTPRRKTMQLAERSACKFSIADGPSVESALGQLITRHFGWAATVKDGDGRPVAYFYPL